MSNPSPAPRKKLMIWPWIVGIVLCIPFLLLAYFGATFANMISQLSGDTVPELQDETPLNQATKADLTASGVERVPGGTYGVVTGIVKNDSERSYSHVQVQINLYDKAGIMLGNAFANANNFEPKGKWKFRAAIPMKGVDKFKVTGVAGWKLLILHFS